MNKLDAPLDAFIMTERPVEYAGFWLRVAARIIDGIAMYAMLAIFMLGLLGIAAIRTDFNSPIPDNNMMVYRLLVILVYIPVILYFPIMESSKYQASLGKMAVGIKVVDMNGNRISFWRAVGRFFSQFFSAITFYIGYMMAGFTEKKQTLHDMVTSTLVVKK